ncbi:g12250 [Coccomyxa viridis]|uniref:G12250 protein n=1 Tax=Coccomyxa viridis TaxID=1274662 RepID=A0ABP1GE58_9CHLO
MLRSAASLLARGRRLGSLATEQTGAQVRSFAEATLQKPDIPVHGIHGRYALALFEAGAKQGQLDKIDTDLKQINQLSEADKMFKQFLQDPSVPKKEKLSSLGEILKAMNVSETTSSLFEVLAENNRLNLVPKIAETFEDIIASARGQVKAIITTAEKLQKDQLATFKKELQKTLQKGQQLILEERVEPAIIGGLIIDVGEKHVDMSILTRVKKIEQVLRESV